MKRLVAVLVLVTLITGCGDPTRAFQKRCEEATRVYAGAPPSAEFSATMIFTRNRDGRTQYARAGFVHVPTAFGGVTQVAYVCENFGIGNEAIATVDPSRVIAWMDSREAEGWQGRLPR